MASAVTTKENIVVTRDYTDNFAIKENAMETLGKKYFGDVDLAALNVGELGFVLEQIANITEDAFNTSSIMLHEAFPNKAVIPESIYSHAAIFQIDNVFASCGECTFMLLLQQAAIKEYGVTDGGKTRFYIDKHTIISVEGVPFTFDYDIEITMRETYANGEWDYDYAAKYVITDNNSISSVNDPYLKMSELKNGGLLLFVTMHQVTRTEITEPIIGNSRINYPVVEFNFENALAGFDVFYKSPTSENWEQLTKLIKFSLGIEQKFCYYRLKDDHTIEISFSPNEKYFQPEFNSELKIVMYNTMGVEGNFDEYTGNKIEFQLFNDIYPYNTKIVIAAKPMTECIGGADRLSLESLQALTVEAYSSATEISDDNDVMSYFYDYKYRYGNEIYVIKRRDDITERVFSAFLLLKNDDYIFPTNTMNVDLVESNFDSVDDNHNRFTLKPGHVFVYKEGVDNTVKMIPGVMSYDTGEVAELMNEYDFVYTNPFLISLNKSPNAIGLYKSIVSQTATLDYVSSNPDVFTQFITSRIHISRDLEPEAKYDMSLSIFPSVTFSDEEIASKYINTWNDITDNYVRVIVGLIGKDGMERGYIELVPREAYPGDPQNVTFGVELTTNDKILSTGEFLITNAIKAMDFITSEYVTIPITDQKVNVYILYKTGGIHHTIFEQYPEFASTGITEFDIVNIYSNKDDGLTYIEPMNMMRSTVKFTSIVSDNETTVNSRLSLLPMIKADIVSDTENFGVFVDKLTQNYHYIEACLPKLRNNTHIDIKFYNTYGKSKNYFIGDNQELLDRVNISIKFQVNIVDGTDDIEIRRQLKTFIKEFVERVNTAGGNDLFISNLIREIENNFASVHHLKFDGINDYSTDYQTISLHTPNLNDLSKEERREYVPEILVVNMDSILLSIDVKKNS